MYDSNNILVYTFSSANKAAEFFICHHTTIMKYVRRQKILKKQWILTTSLINEE